jgi:nitrite reductase/ring-hydroxylating ferredoxin subunit
LREVRAAALADVTQGTPHLVEAEGTRLVLVRVGDRVHAIGDTCAHQGGPLSAGKLSGIRLACPWHGWMYDVRTGQCLFPGRGAAVPSYPVRVDGDAVFVAIPSFDGHGPSSP